MLEFKKDGCELVKNIIPKETLKLIHKYTFEKNANEVKNDMNSYNYSDIVPGPHTYNNYSDMYMELIATTIQRDIEQVTNLQLFPTYTFYRTYFPGNTLKHHIDKPPCDISATILLDAHYKNDSSYRWKIFADPEPYRNNETLDPYNIPDNKGVGIEQKPGDALIYRGCDIPHWREEFVAEEGSYHTQLFCHFIDKNGPYYPKWKYSGRPGLGFPPESSKYIYFKNNS